MLSRVDSEQVALLSVKNSFVFIPKFLFFLKDLLLQENEIAKEKKPLYSLVIMYAWCVDGYNATF